MVAMRPEEAPPIHARAYPAARQLRVLARVRNKQLAGLRAPDPRDRCAPAAAAPWLPPAGECVEIAIPMKPAAKPGTETEARAALLRQIPSVDELLALPRLKTLAGRVDRALVVEIARAVLANVRARITGEREITAVALNSAELEGWIAAEVERVLALSLQPVINATGVILHTNLGRAPLPAEAIENLRQTATQYSNLEYDLAAGARGKHKIHTARLIERLTGAETAIVVNNCAAAVLLVLAALAKGGEVIVSRGELIEIGDGFRIPEIMAESGAILREVGTTNRTRVTDYENGISEKTRLLLRVHPSNFEITGFAEKPSLEELVALSRRTSLPLVERKPACSTASMTSRTWRKLSFASPRITTFVS